MRLQRIICAYAKHVSYITTTILVTKFKLSRIFFPSFQLYYFISSFYKTYYRIIINHSIKIGVLSALKKARKEIRDDMIF